MLVLELLKEWDEVRVASFDYPRYGDARGIEIDGEGQLNEWCLKAAREVF